MSTNARMCDLALADRLFRQGIEVNLEKARILRRAEKALHRWAELQCGTEHGAIEQDERTGKWYWVNAYSGKRQHHVADRETGALKRIAGVCAALGLHYYHQSDPRGAALYVSKTPLDQNNYDRGVCCAL